MSASPEFTPTARGWATPAQAKYLADLVSTQIDLLREVYGEDSAQRAMAAWGAKPRPDLMSRDQVSQSINQAKATNSSLRQRKQDQSPAALQPTEPESPKPLDVFVPQAKPVPDGTYTIEFADGTHRTLRVAVQEQTESFLPGKQIVSYLSGADNSRDYTGFAHLTDRGARVWKNFADNDGLIQALRVLLGDPKAAAVAYARRSERCGICNRKLTHPASLKAGIGPDCAKKAGW